MRDKQANQLIREIKIAIIEMIYFIDELPKTKFSDYLNEKINLDYTYMSKIFSEKEGTTIEQFVILHKIERVKELILADELNLTKISQKMKYSSVAHLSNQFRKVTGLSPRLFKLQAQKKHQT